jgi:hypothetical protein
LKPKDRGFSRSFCVENFLTFLTVKYSGVNRVLIVGYIGSKESPDPEIIAMKDVFDCDIKSIGLSATEDFVFDLNSSTWVLEPKFDILIVGHVFEHIFNFNNSFKSITSMLKQGGYLYITGPTSNYYHLSPEFYSSGFDINFFTNNLNSFGFEECVLLRVGTERLYFMTHALFTWPSIRAHKLPLLFAYSEIKFPLRLLLYFKNFLLILIATLKSKTFTSNPKYTTEMLGIYRKA